MRCRAFRTVQVRELKPSCVNTVPWVVEGLVTMLTDGRDAKATIAALSSLRLITYGGAALAPHCAPGECASAARLRPRR